MSPNLTRKALYELVWTKPRSQIAKELGVSDVWIGKMCRRQNVPAPPPGYWANLVAGSRRRRRYVKPPLPYTVVERIEEAIFGSSRQKATSPCSTSWTITTRLR